MHLFKRTGAYGDVLNSYDILKLIALLTMVIDHLGAYFWPDAEILRAIGRISFPLFLFLVGYSGRWQVKTDLWIWAVLIVPVSIFVHRPVFSLNILFTIIVTRYVMAWHERRGTSERELRGFFIACVIWYPFFLFMEYSSVAFLFAMSGYLLRHEPNAHKTRLFFWATIVVHFLSQYVFFHFHLPAALVMLACAPLVAFLLLWFRIQPVSNRNLPTSLRHILLWCARNTLPLYSLHVMAFLLLERYYFPQHFTSFQWW